MAKECRKSVGLKIPRPFRFFFFDNGTMIAGNAWPVVH
jgi:hypothetical protein